MIFQPDLHGSAPTGLSGRSFMRRLMDGLRTRRAQRSDLSRRSATKTEGASFFATQWQAIRLQAIAVASLCSVQALGAVAKPLTNKKSVQNCFLFICR